MTVAIWLSVALGLLPLLWWWNDIWYRLTASFRSSYAVAKLPPGHMGLPIIGEMFTFLWYFKFLRRPDDYINSKRNKHGDGIGMYRTHLFGYPSVIVYSPAANKFVFRHEESFILEWPNVELIGKNSLSAVHGKAHTRIRSLVSRSLNQPDALRRITIFVQPRIISALKSWAERRTINSYKEIKKVTLENMGMYFASFEPGPTIDKLDEYFHRLLAGVRSYRLNIPGFAYHHALQCRKKAVAIFKKELEKRNNDEDRSTRPINDLMDGLMKLKDEEGGQLSDNEILDNIVNILAAGYETTTLSTMWVIYFLAKYPKVLQKLRDENVSLKKSKNEEFVTSDEMLKMKYTMKVVDETIRLANVAAIVFRTTTKDVQYEGYIIPKGWKVMLWIRYLHTNPDNFDDPLSFNPDRWDAPISASETYRVFGGGSRTCVGNMLARVQLAVFLHHLSTEYKWELVNPDAKIKYLSHPKPEDGVEIVIQEL
ncbi:ent-kaurenoic acid oxidase 2-like [Cynara cardunculus var. scolymus]|uniref:ent-kaurenoic acid oxidase 2-like n=1 Tax=Cynara cardunculus var. scolymus TaxID=59895 RepID=UPI000D62E40A|nr:ent-kaurenoic acid oxidase 2-like [Cynara cardunculus var. scolymus]